MIKLGDNNVTLKLGSQDVSKVYLGETQVYPNAPATNLVMQRISDTEYLVTGDSGTADLTFTRESDSLVDAKGVQSLPYTFTHTAGEKWSVNGVNAWGLKLEGSYFVEADLITDLATFDLARFYVNFQLGVPPSAFDYIISRIQSAGSYARIRLREGLNWIQLEIRNANSPVDTGLKVTSSIAFKERDWFEFSQNDNMKMETNLNSSGELANTEYLKGFSPNAKTRFESPQVGYWVIHGFSWNGEDFKLKEGSGLSTYGENGTKLNLSDANIWITV